MAGTLVPGRAHHVQYSYKVPGHGHQDHWPARPHMAGSGMQGGALDAAPGLLGNPLLWAAGIFFAGVYLVSR
jgi:hypothetical protein